MSKKDDLLKMCVEPNTITVINNVINTREYAFYCYKAKTQPFSYFDEALKTIRQSRKYSFNTNYTDGYISIMNSEFSSFEEKLEFASKLEKTANIVVVRTTHYPGIDKHISVRTIRNTNKLTESPNDLAKTGKATFYSPGQLVEYWGGLERIYDEDDLVGKALIFKEYLANFLSLMYSLTENDIEWLQDNRRDILEDFIIYNYAASSQGRISEFLRDNIKEFKTAPWKQINTRILSGLIKSGDPRAIQTIQSIFK